MRNATFLALQSFFEEGAALRATTNPGAAKDRRCRSGGDLPPPGLRLPPSRDALRRTSRLADGGASTPPIRAPSPRRDTNAAFAAHESTRNPHSTSRALSVKSAERRFRVRRRPLFASGGMAKPEGGDGDFTAVEAMPRSRPWNRRRQSPTGDSPCRRVRGRA